jgi:hypothetical protein
MKSPRRLAPAAALLALVGVSQWATSSAPEAPQADPGTETERARQLDTRIGMSPVTGDHGAAERAEAALDRAQPYIPRQVMVELADADAAREVAARHGARLVRAPGPAGLAVLELADDAEPGAALTALLDDAAIAAASPVGRVFGAKSNKSKGNQKSKKNNSSSTDTSAGSDTPSTDPSTGTDSTASDSPTDDSTANDSTANDSASSDAPSSSSTPSPALEDLQWHLDWASVPGGSDLSDITIAVIDSGAALETVKIRGQDYVQAPSLADVNIVAPMDFVDGDIRPLDQHQHGTHISTTILGDGAVKGVAAGAALMPLRVLDEDNSGNEADLIDAIVWATDHGADVINLSLSFPPGYVPSKPLQQAIQAAHAAGVVMVAAAGNDGLSNQVTWPAASPLVISVGAYSIDNGRAAATAYTNLGAAVDIMAPGGDLGRDANADGLPDGIIGESFPAGQPDEVGPWMMAGSSQAAAVVAGAAAHLLASGSPPDQVRGALYMGATDWGKKSAEWGVGAGGLDVQSTLSVDAGSALAVSAETHVAMMPYVTWGTDALTGVASAKARFRITVLDELGVPLADGGVVQATVWSSDGHTTASCNIDDHGQCTLKSDSAVLYDSSGEVRPLAWALTVESVVNKNTGLISRPQTALPTSDALEVMLEAIDAQGPLRNAALAVHWPEGTDAELGQLTESYAVVNAGTGLASSPLGLAFLPSAVQAKMRNYELDLDGTGLSSSPLGMLPVQRLVLDGSGLSSSPLGFRELKLVAFNGSGLSSSPLGFTAMDMVNPEPGAPSLGLGLNGAVALMGQSSIEGASSNNTLLHELVEDGGWLTEAGHETAAALTGSGAVDVGVTPEAAGVSAGDGGLPVEL